MTVTTSSQPPPTTSFILVAIEIGRHRLTGVNMRITFAQARAHHQALLDRLLARTDLNPAMVDQHRKELESTLQSLDGWIERAESDPEITAIRLDHTPQRRCTCEVCTPGYTAP